MQSNTRPQGNAPISWVDSAEVRGRPHCKVSNTRNESFKCGAACGFCCRVHFQRSSFKATPPQQESRRQTRSGRSHRRRCDGRRSWRAQSRADRSQPAVMSHKANAHEKDTPSSANKVIERADAHHNCQLCAPSPRF